MNKYQSEARRRVIRKIILEDKRRFYRSVDDWYHTVVNAWPTGAQYAPAKGTIRDEMFKMCAEGAGLSHRLRERGWFHQYVFRVVGGKEAGEGENDEKSG